MRLGIVPARRQERADYDDGTSSTNACAPPAHRRGPRGRARPPCPHVPRRRSPSTRRAYETDLRDFAGWLETDNSPAALAYLISQGPGPANELAMNYKAALQGRGLSAGTVNRRLSTLRSLMKMGRTVGLCTFGLDVESEPSESYRDTRGPDVAKIRGLIGQLQVRADKGKRQAFRDLAIVRLLFNLGLRRGEVVSLDVEHYEVEGQRLSIKGKGRQSGNGWT